MKVSKDHAYFLTNPNEEFPISRADPQQDFFFWLPRFFLF